MGALGVYKCVGALVEAGKDIKGAYYRMLVAFYGELPRFDFFKPKAPTMADRMEDLSILVMHLVSTKDGPIAQEERQQIKWRGGGSGRTPGGG